MSKPSSPPPPAPDRNAPLEERLRAAGADLQASFRALLASGSDIPQRPNRLAALLGLNRAVASRLLQALASSDPLEALHLAPGPEPLRKVATGLGEEGAPAELVAAAAASADAFDQLIRDEAGTRPALDALLVHELPAAREKFELQHKYSVFKGMSQLKGAQGELWLGIAVVAPSATAPDRHDLTWVNGALALQRLRPGVDIGFSYRHRSSSETPPEASATEAERVQALEQFCVNPPATLEAQDVGDTIHYTLPDTLLGPKAKVDMFVVDHHPAAMRRFVLPQDDPDVRTRNALILEPAVPVAALLFDVYLHEEAFPGSEPLLIQYDTAYRGLANVNDPTRDLDRVDVKESVEFLGHDMRNVEAAELPSYAQLLAHLAAERGWDPARFRGYRTRIQYPPYGWQTSLSFQPPAR